jgi:hypothetical protein
MGLSLWSEFSAHVPARLGFPAIVFADFAGADCGDWSEGAAAGMGPAAFWAVALPWGKRPDAKISARIDAHTNPLRIANL